MAVPSRVTGARDQCVWRPRSDRGDRNVSTYVWFLPRGRRPYRVFTGRASQRCLPSHDDESGRLVGSRGSRASPAGYTCYNTEENRHFTRPQHACVLPHGLFWIALVAASHRWKTCRRPWRHSWTCSWRRRRRSYSSWSRTVSGALQASKAMILYHNRSIDLSRRARVDPACQTNVERSERGASWILQYSLGRWELHENTLPRAVASLDCLSSIIFRASHPNPSKHPKRHRIAPVCTRNLNV